MAKANLALAVAESGQLEGARSLFEASLPAHRKAYAEHDTSLLYYLNNYSNLLLQLKDYRSARPLLEQALRGFTEQNGPDDLITLVTAYNLATAARELGDVTFARSLLSQVSQRGQCVLPSGHPLLEAAHDLRKTLG